MTICLKKEYFDFEETLKSASASLSSQGQCLQQEHSIDKQISEEEIHLCGKYSFFWMKTEAMDSSKSFFSTGRRLHNANDNVVSYHKDSVAASPDLEDKRRSENIAFPFLAKSLWISRCSSNHQHHLVTINFAL
jgi:hypothetical protein